MYSEQDLALINGKIKKNLSLLLPIVAVILALYIGGMVWAVEWLVMVAGPALFVAICYGVLAYLRPNMQYRRFLLDLRDGLSRELRGTVVSVAEQDEMQDGARVLPVHIFLTDEQDERIVYLNASKKDYLPGPGTEVELQCFGRHIREARAL